MYINYRGQYSRLNQNPLFGQHREWVPNDSIFNKGFSFDGAVFNKIKRFSAVTFRPGWKIVKLARGEKYFEYQDPRYRTRIQNKFNIRVAENRDIVPDETNHLTVFAGEFFIGNKIQSISMKSEHVETPKGKKDISVVIVKCAVGAFEIPASRVIKLEPLKLTKEDDE